MSDYNSLKAAINANIRKNGRQEITGQVLNGILRAMVDALGAGFTFRAVASPDTDPGSTDSRVFYIATVPGTYEHMGGVEIEEGEVAILKFYDNTWHKEPTGLASQAALESLGDALGAAIGEKMTFCELWCDGDKITRKDSQIALSFAEVKELMDDPSQFVALKYIDVFWMLPQYDDEGGAIIFTGVSLMSAQGDLWRVAINEENQISDYSIAIENQYLKTNDLGDEQRDNFKTYPTTQAVNAALNDKVDKVPGKGLSANDFTTQEKNKLAGLNNYDDTELRNQVQNGVTAASGSAAQAAASAASAESKYAGILQAMENLPDGSAVSAQVALNTQKVTELSDKIDALSLGKFYGFYSSLSSLPSATIDGYAYVGSSSPYAIYNAVNGTWSNSGATLGHDEVYVTPEMFGAVADGETDDAPALRECFTYASNNRMPIILKGGATYYLASKQGGSVISASYLYLCGNNALFKVADLGDFDSLIHARSVNGYSNISNLTIEFDNNNSTSQAGKELAEAGARRTCFVLGGTPQGLGESYIQNVHVINALGVWEFDFNQCSKGYIKDCVIDYSTQVMSWDRTSIYLGCNNFECSNNRLNGRGYGRTGIETHGYNITMSDNVIVDYSAPILLTTVYDTTPNVDVLALVCENNYCDCKQPIQVWGIGNRIDSIIIRSNFIKSSSVDQSESGPGSCFWLYDNFSNTEIDNIIIEDNYFTQAIGNAPVVYISPSQGNNAIIHNVEFNRNTFNCGSYFLCAKSWRSDSAIDAIRFCDNIINCHDQSKIVALVNSESMFKKIDFISNTFKTNPANLDTASLPNGAIINWVNNNFENMVLSATDVCRFKGEQNLDFTYLPVTLDTIGKDFYGRYVKGYVDIYALASTDIVVDSAPKTIYKGWNRVYTNGKNWNIGANGQNIGDITIADTLMGNALNATFMKCGAEALDLSYPFSMNVTSAQQTFQNCVNLVSLIVRGWNMSRVANFYMCFGGCSNLPVLDLGDWDFGSASNMDYMFSGCSALEVLRLGKCNIARVVTANNIFRNTNSLAKVILEGVTSQNLTKLQGYLTTAGKNFTTSTETKADGTLNAVISMTL